MRVGVKIDFFALLLVTQHGAQIGKGNAALADQPGEKIVFRRDLGHTRPGRQTVAVDALAVRRRGDDELSSP
jgi:hypothetical protein